MKYLQMLSLLKNDSFTINMLLVIEHTVKNNKITKFLGHC